MDILDSSMLPNEEAVDLNELVTIPTPKLPMAAARNRAATTAMLSGTPETAVENYRLMLHEAEQGTNVLQKQLESNVQERVTQLDMQGVMSVLSDPTIPQEKKQAAFNSFRESQLLQDSNTTLLTNALTAESVDEPKEQEDARINTAGSFRSVLEAQQAVQGVQNALGASLDPVSSKTFFEMLELYVMPFGNNISSGRIAIAAAEKQGRKLSVLDKLGLYLFAGHATSTTAESLERIPIDKREEFAKGLADTIAATSGIVFSNNNQFVQFDKASTILEIGGYSSLEEFIDNVSPLLDLIGVGQAIRGSVKAVKARGAVGAVKEAITPRLGILGSKDKPLPPLVGDAPVPPKPTGPTKAPSSGNIFEDTRTRVGTPELPVRTPELDNLFEQRANLLGDSGQLLDKGQVANIQEELKGLQVPGKTDLKERIKELQKSEKLSYKEAEKKATKEQDAIIADYNATKARLEGQLDYNALAAKNEQKLAELDKKIAELQKIPPKTEPAAFNPIADVIQRVKLNSVARIEHPSAPANVIQHGNPTQARAIHEAVVLSQTDELAEGLYGVSREQAIMNDVLPQVGTASGAVTSKVPNIQKDLMRKIADGAKDIIDMLGESGATEFTRAEKERAKATISHDFKNAEGLTIIDSMSSFIPEGGKVKINAVYGLEEGSFLKAEDALSQAKRALRKYGILDDEIEILKKEGLDHIPVRVDDELQVDGNYLVRVKTSSEIDTTDVGRLESLDVKRNWLDRTSPWLGKFLTDPARSLFDAASMVHPTISGSASVMSDRTSRLERILLEKANDYAKAIKKFDKVRRDKISAYLWEANTRGIDYDRVDLAARGFVNEEMDAIKLWRDAWDAHFYLENYDAIRTLTNSRFELFKNANAELIAKKIGKNQNITKVYDPATDMVVPITKQEQDDLYNMNGSLAVLRRPTTFGTEVAEYMVVRNTPTEYLRKFRNTDQVLNYRPGYYQIQYNAPKFVDELIRDTSGNITGKKTVAVAGDSKEAEAFAKRMAASAGIQNWRDVYDVRGDVRAMPRGGDEWWDLNSASGRIAQRHRGQLLEDSSGLNHLGDGSYVVDPVDSAIRAMRSVAARTIKRPVVEVAKARALEQYGDTFPSNGKGGKDFPTSAAKIAPSGKEFSSHVADARTTVAYINYLENGYINTIDEALKAGMYAIAEMAAKNSTVERFLNKGAKVAPMSLAKNSTFMALVGSNILRQLLVQSHQAIRTVAYNPIGFLNGGTAKLLAAYPAQVMGITRTDDFAQFVKKSGMMDSVDKQNLVRGALLDAADSNNKAIKVAKKTGAFVRRLGFDTGEQASLLGHLASVYEQYKRTGKDMTDLHTLDEAYAEVRALTYEMNFAGDMPYNQTMPNILLQFMQVPHKAWLQLTNRKLDGWTRARLFAGDLVLWGPPSALIASMLGDKMLPDNPTMREWYLHGAESMMINKMINELFDDDEFVTDNKTKIDLSAFDSRGMEGWAKMFMAVKSGGMDEMIMASPAGQLFIRDQGRTQNAIAAMQRYFTGFWDENTPPETALSVIKEASKILSGFNSAYKAWAVLETKKRLDQYGKQIDPSATTVEAVATLLGFETQTTASYYELSQKLSKDSKARREEVIQAYKTVTAYYARQFAEGQVDPNFTTAVTGFILQRYKDDPEAMAILADQMKNDFAPNQQRLLMQIIRAVGIPTYDTLEHDLARDSTLTETQKQEIRDRFKHIRNANTKKEE